jgi:23S rRNA pseudouridine1911/1915/1917 synthase
VNVLYEDNHLLVLVKPTGLATMGLAEGEETLLTQAKQYIKLKYSKPGEVYLGIVSRLDVPVSGVVLFARTSKAAARLNEQFREHIAEKIYLALTEGSITPPQARCIDRIKDDDRHRKVWIAKDGSGKESVLSYKKREQYEKCSLVEVRLETGRKHQIRIQLSSRGFPILGDIKYGAKMPFPDGIALHAWKLTVRHPVGGHPVEFTAPPPPAFEQIIHGRKTVFPAVSG